jgi:hypothetical protein
MEKKSLIQSFRHHVILKITSSTKYLVAIRTEENELPQ